MSPAVWPDRPRDGVVFHAYTVCQCHDGSVSLCVGLALGAAPLVASETTPLEFRAVVGEAALIVRGHVTDVRAVEVPDRGVETIATLAVDAVLKGETDGFVSFRLPGGQIGRYRTVMAGAPTVVGE